VFDKNGKSFGSVKLNIEMWADEEIKQIPQYGEAPEQFLINPKIVNSSIANNSPNYNKSLQSQTDETLLKGDQIPQHQSLDAKQ